MIDAAIHYDSLYDGKSYILVQRNELYVPLMGSNLILPFMLREAGIQVNDKSKIHADDPTEDDHAIIFLETKFHILLSLWGIFSYFPSARPRVQDLQGEDDVYILKPATWNPHSDACTTNGDSMLDWEGKAT